MRKNISANSMMHLAVALFCLVSIAATAVQANDIPEKLILSGADWRIHDDAEGSGAERGMPTADASSPGWVPASVPGNIQADLEAAHLLKPLWYGAGDPRLEHVAKKDWWYLKDFDVPAGFKGKRLTLVFDGVDHECAVWLNGKPIGANTGMFKRFQFDVTETVKVGQSNKLTVRITRMHDENNRPQWPGKPLAELKSPTNTGWDWGVRIWTLGIWKDVRLEATGPARIDWTRVQTALSEDHAKAEITTTLEIDSSADLPAKARFQITGQGQTADATVEAELKKGRNVIQAKLALDRPALWWPAGHGDQPLYMLRAELLPADGGPAMDVRDARFGVRDVRWVHTEGAPADFISRYQMILNGRPIRTIGSNLIPPDLLFGRMGPRALNLLRHAKATGMNTLRIWGGGVILHDDFYDLADELGIMLSQEFPLANRYIDRDPMLADPTFLHNLDYTVRNIIRQVQNHPSIIEWTGGNEMKWSSLTKHPALQLLQKVTAEDDDRLFRATCPDWGATHGSWVFDLWFDCRYYDERKTMRAGEFGTSSPANLEVWHRDIPPKDQWPIIGKDNPLLKRKHVGRAILNNDYWLRKNILDDVFGTFDDLPELVRAGQFYASEGLRYSMDSFRRKGKRIGGMTTWDFNEPWTNGAGSYLVDYDGRPLMAYEFFKQAIVPVSLSLKYESVFYSLQKGLKAELFLVSDAPEEATNLRWKWLARDRRGTVFARREGTASIAPLEVKSLGEVELMPPETTIFGPFFVELRLEKSDGKLLAERLHVFAPANLPNPFASLLISGGDDPNDDPTLVNTTDDRPGNTTNLAFCRRHPIMTTFASPEPVRGWPLGINDGAYGNDNSWSGAWFQLQLLGKPATLGRFRFGRDRTGFFSDQLVNYMKIETSLDGKTWQTVFEKDNLSSQPDFSPRKTVEVQIAPVQAQYVKVTLVPPQTDSSEHPRIDEFEIFGPATQQPANLPYVEVLPRPELWRPVRRTALELDAKPPRVEDGQEVLDLIVKNAGPMTALFCEPHPMIEYRTDLFIHNNHCFIPPGESRTITIRADREAAGGLSLAQTGWRISCWNADDVVIEPSDDVLLAVGRRDAMCREFLGYFDPKKIEGIGLPPLNGRLPDAAKLPYLLDKNKLARFEFPLIDAQSKRPARLWIHTADQAGKQETVVEVIVNGMSIEQTLPKGLGIQKTDPAHLAFPATLVFPLPANVLRQGKNELEVRVKNGGWFSWDAISIIESNLWDDKQGS